MTVKELITELLDYDQELEVYIDNGDGLVQVDEVEIADYFSSFKKVVIK